MMNRSNYSDFLTVVVGTAEHTFHVHQDLICNKSNFFKAAVSREWQEAESKTVYLPEHRPAAFRIYLDTIYTPDADLLDSARSHAEEMVEDEEDDFRNAGNRRKPTHALAKLYILGDFLDDAAFKMDAFKAMVCGCNNGKLQAGKEALRIIFEQTPVDCCLQKFIADCFARCLKRNDVDELGQNYSPNCVWAVCKALIDKRYGDGWPKEWDAEKYLENVIC